MSIYSVFQRRINAKTWILVQGWRNRQLKDKRLYFCCLLLQNKEIKIEKVIKKKHFGAEKQSQQRRRVFQHQCRLDTTPEDNDIVAATIVWYDPPQKLKNTTTAATNCTDCCLCPKNINAYKFLDKALFPNESKLRTTTNETVKMTSKSIQNHSDFSFAVCAKLVFHSLNPNLTIEWMEYHRFVSHLFTPLSISLSLSLSTLA